MLNVGHYWELESWVAPDVCPAPDCSRLPPHTWTPVLILHQSIPRSALHTMPYSKCIVLQESDHFQINADNSCQFQMEILCQWSRCGIIISKSPMSSLNKEKIFIISQRLTIIFIHLKGRSIQMKNKIINYCKFFLLSRPLYFNVNLKREGGGR